MAATAAEHAERVTKRDLHDLITRALMENKQALIDFTHQLALVQ
jgi:hypothetical protein